MSDETFLTRNSRTGKLQRATADQIKASNSRRQVVEIVPEGTKPLAPGLFKPGEVGEFKNPEPVPDAVAAAQAEYDALVGDGHAPNSGVVREAKAKLAAAQEEVDAATAAAAEANQQIQDGEAPGTSVETEGDSK